MEIEEVSYFEYHNIIGQSYHFFGTAEFTELNRLKCESLHYILFKDSRYKLGLVGGIRDGVLLSPFSAPFGGFSFIKSDVKLTYIEESIDLLIQWAKGKGVTQLSITLPPSIYDESFISKQINCFFRKGFQLSSIDLNYSFYLKNFNQNYQSEILWRNARKNLNVALKSELSFMQCHSDESKKEAYNIIKSNREARKFPIRMTWEQMKDTLQIVQHDCFLVKNKECESIASAIVFHISTRIVQVIYWGDLPQFSHFKTMNYLSYKVFDYYNQIGGIKFVDVGPSTENSLPNIGLCEFKEGVGCEIFTKNKFTYKINS